MEYLQWSKAKSIKKKSSEADVFGQCAYFLPFAPPRFKPGTRMRDYSAVFSPPSVNKSFEVLSHSKSHNAFYIILGISHVFHLRVCVHS